ncbi:chemotaxis protein CheB [Pontibacter beigongshangensis]|uniref:chemotaxis protein CheB n=1 Tax=Pontibacter beigongshangensis TaxID=2574733 RepID=UPI00164F890D|nr:chemotaxis protein CheB [Pontibacter beigongshangensis]
MRENKRIIVIGTSAGGMQALCQLVEKLPADFPASIFVVQHLSADSSTQFLVNRLSQHTALTCKIAEDLDPILPATIYMAPADRHLLLNEEQVLIVRGPRENQFRPSIDPLFRSAAGYHSAGVIGVILTGFMSDGVDGMESIARSGGQTVVQDPADAEYPQLPLDVVRQVRTDHVVPLHEMADILFRLVQKPVPAGVAVPTDIWQEVQIVERIMRNSTMTSIEDLENLGERSPYSCPDCGGGLWEVSKAGNVSRFRCHSGHAYTQDMLLLGMSNSLEETLWVAMRTLEERRNILLNISKAEGNQNNKR